MKHFLLLALWPLAAVGFVFLSIKLSALFAIFLSPILKPNKLSKFKTSDAYAIVTGASEGIGREFAVQLAAKGFNLLLISRSTDKLNALKNEILSKSKVNVIVFPFDFTTTEKSEWKRMDETVKGIGNITVLVNNVAINHDIPVSFLEEDPKRVDDIIRVNISATMDMTRLTLSKMISQRNGLILNIGSVAGLAPSAYLTVYAASKSFLRSWSQGLAHEVAKDGVHVEHVNTYFVVTNMSKIRKSNFTTPYPKQYVQSVLGKCGNSFSSTPYYSHGILGWVIGFFSENLLAKKSADMHLDFRRRALRKREREAKEVKKVD